ncbi:biopolymer transporter ExbD [Parachlamydia sp. AcF125]|uniref:ExbD/TolR family protein n=1 Tax=Parachlamydia sp. AcF125 TaxID=2795736 RepID=UPI001BCA2DBB|nr:biopolymer transporter ExbD [Parachlamydia sp. AcF125]MBS4167742.1 Biopolymer transport protein ExbD [Parachlamydia sp. AcF125]
MENFRKRHAKPTIEEPVINLTPLIDVVFVILIMFIIIAPLMEMEQIELAHASHASKEVSSVQTNSPIHIHVTKDNAIFLNKQLVSLTDLPALLLRQKQLFPEALPQLFHDQTAYFGTYQKVKNAAEEAGFAKMDVILNPS